MPGIIEEQSFDGRRPVLQHPDQLPRAQEQFGQSFDCVCDAQPAGLVGLGFAFSAPSVEASVLTSNFTVTAAALGAGPYGTVTVTDFAGGGGVTIDVTLPTTSWLFVNTGNGTNHEAFAFNVNPAINPANITLTGSTAGDFIIDHSLPAFDSGFGQFT